MRLARFLMQTVDSGARTNTHLRIAIGDHSRIRFAPMLASNY
jgi:hypothetical protein